MDPDQVNELIRCIRALSRGDERGPMGMEAIAMALCGKDGPGENSVGGGLYAIADAIKGLTEAIETCAPEIAKAVYSLQTM